MPVLNFTLRPELCLKLQCWQRRVGGIKILWFHCSGTKKSSTNVLPFDMPDAVSARLATADNILVITAQRWCRSPWINVLWVSQPRPASPTGEERLNTQDLARGLKPSSGFVAQCCSNASGDAKASVKWPLWRWTQNVLRAIFSAKFCSSCFRLHPANSQCRQSKHHMMFAYWNRHDAVKYALRLVVVFVFVVFPAPSHFHTVPCHYSLSFAGAGGPISWSVYIAHSEQQQKSRPHEAWWLCDAGQTPAE